MRRFKEKDRGKKDLKNLGMVRQKQVVVGRFLKLACLKNDPFCTEITFPNPSVYVMVTVPFSLFSSPFQSHSFVV